MQRTVIVRGVVSVEAVFGQLIDKPAVYSLVEMRWLDSKEKEAQQGRKTDDQPWCPIGFGESRFPISNLVAQRRKIC